MFACLCLHIEVYVAFNNQDLLAELDTNVRCGYATSDTFERDTFAAGVKSGVTFDMLETSRVLSSLTHGRVFHAKGLRGRGSTFDPFRVTMFWVEIPSEI